MGADALAATELPAAFVGEGMPLTRANPRHSPALATMPAAALQLCFSSRIREACSLTPAKEPFDLDRFLSRANGGKTIKEYARGQTIFCQQDPANAIFYLQQGEVKLTVVSSDGKEAIIGILGEGDFFGEGCLIGQRVRVFTAEAVSVCLAMRIEKDAFVLVLHQEPALSERFVAHLISRNIRFQEDLVDQLFNSSERRLARVLLLLSNFAKEGRSEPAVAKLSQETLAQMIGTTRSRVSFFMNKFRKLGFIDYTADEMHVHSSLLSVLLHPPEAREPEN